MAERTGGTKDRSPRGKRAGRGATPAGKPGGSSGRAPARPAGSARRRKGEPPRPPGRYTPPIPREVRRSPSWYPWMLLVLAVVGVGVIIANYSSALPDSPTNWYTLGALVALLAAALLATRYR